MYYLNNYFKYMRYPKPTFILLSILSILAVLLLAKKTFACELTPTPTPTITDTPSITPTITSTPTPIVTISPTTTPTPTEDSTTIQASTQSIASNEDISTQNSHTTAQGISNDLSTGISTSSLTGIFNNVLPTITNPNIKKLNENYTSTSLSRQTQDLSTNVSINSQVPLSNQDAANTITTLPTNISQPASPIVSILNQIGNSNTFEYFSTESQSMNFKAITKIKAHYIVNGIKYFINAINIQAAHTKNQSSIKISKNNNSLNANIQTSLESAYKSFTHIHLMAHAL